mgnify:CR=1 FL=1
MTLTTQKAKWVNLPNWTGPSYFVGVTFDCTHCGCRLAVNFWPPIDPEKLSEIYGFSKPAGLCWTRQSGETFENLTLMPSIDVSGHWHGHVQRGILVSV